MYTDKEHFVETKYLSNNEVQSQLVSQKHGNLEEQIYHGTLSNSYFCNFSRSALENPSLLLPIREAGKKIKWFPERVETVHIKEL